MDIKKFMDTALTKLTLSDQKGFGEQKQEVGLFYTNCSLTHNCILQNL